MVLLLLTVALPASAASPPELATVDAWPVWSPDGRAIAFTRIHPGRSLDELEVARPRTHRVTKLAQNLFQLLPAGRPTGSRSPTRRADDVWVTALAGREAAHRRGGSPAFGDAIARVVNGHSSSAGQSGPSTWSAGPTGRRTGDDRVPARRRRVHRRPGRRARCAPRRWAESRRPGVGARRLTARVHASATRSGLPAVASSRRTRSRARSPARRLRAGCPTGAPSSTAGAGA